MNKICKKCGETKDEEKFPISRKCRGQTCLECSDIHITENERICNKS